MTLDRYARESGVVPVPAIDVDASVTSVEDLGKLRTKFRDILRCFDHPKFIHLGPKITSILVSASDGNGGGGGGSTDASIYDYIPLPLEETTFILCANSLHGTEDLNLLPENVILAHYGFQVSSCRAMPLFIHAPKLANLNLGSFVCPYTINRYLHTTLRKSLIKKFF